MNLNALLGHMDIFPIIYGIIIWFGIAVIVIKVRMGWWISLILDLAVFAVVFKLHGGAMNGAFAAAIAGLLAGLTLQGLWIAVGWLMSFRRA